MTSCGLDEYALNCLMEMKVRKWARKKRILKMKQDVEETIRKKKEKSAKRSRYPYP